jgi:hypothetical protein
MSTDAKMRLRPHARANRGVAPPPRPARMRKTVKGAEPLRAVGTSDIGAYFAKLWHMRTRHGHSDAA